MNDSNEIEGLLVKLLSNYEIQKIILQIMLFLVK